MYNLHYKAGRKGGFIRKGKRQKNKKFHGRPFLVREKFIGAYLSAPHFSAPFADFSVRIDPIIESNTV